MRRRTRAREIAVQFLYQLDLRGDEVTESLQAFVEGETEEKDVREFAIRLVKGARRLQEETDSCLREVARNWDLNRMAAVDRNVLRMAVFELLHCPDIPPKVTINEAIEIGKKYSTANSGAFINGILDRVRLDRLEKPGQTADPGAHTTLGQES
jgi:transcription antitermination factor NusB